MLLKESFFQAYECENIEEAQKHFYEWISWRAGIIFFEFACSVLEKK